MPLNDLERANFRNHTHTSDQVIDAATGEPIEVTPEVDTSGLQARSEKDQASGYAGLDSGGKLLAAQLPGAAATDVETAAAVAALSSVYQPLDSDLTALAGLAIAADKLPYGSGSHAMSLADFTAFARTLLDDADAATARATLGVDLTAYATSADLAAKASDPTSAVGDMLYRSSAVTYTPDYASGLTATSNQSGIGSFPGAITDNNDGTWGGINPGATGSWFKLDLGQARTIGSVRVSSGIDANSQIQAFSIQSSPDNSVWTTQSTHTPSSGGAQVFQPTWAPVTARYWRLLATTGSYGAYWVINDWKIYGATIPSLAALGSTSFGRALLALADASALQTAAGMSTFIKTLMDDTDAATARATLGVSAGATPEVNAAGRIFASQNFR